MTMVKNKPKNVFNYGIINTWENDRLWMIKNGMAMDFESSNPMHLKCTCNIFMDFLK